VNTVEGPSNKTVYLIAGATAVGKTAVAIELATQLNTEIISADSRQCYMELNIGVARPSLEELQKVKHHFIASHSLTKPVNAAVFERFALGILETIFSTHNSAVVVGGTGLYLDALCYGLDNIPQIPAATRANILANYATMGLPWLQEQLRVADPDFLLSVHQQNPHRMMRALEVVLATGQTIRSFQRGVTANRAFNIKRFGLDLPRPELYQHINNRVDQMMDAGLLQEATAIFESFQLGALPLSSIPPALNTVGYVELFQFLKGEYCLTDAVSKIKQHTRNYAKRQLTWFRKDPTIEWLAPNDFLAALTRRVAPDG
jgi:tRNA dimethylallyltransferase